MLTVWVTMALPLAGLTTDTGTLGVSVPNVLSTGRRLPLTTTVVPTARVRLVMSRLKWSFPVSLLVTYIMDPLVKSPSDVPVVRVPAVPELLMKWTALLLDAPVMVMARTWRLFGANRPSVVNVPLPLVLRFNISVNVARVLVSRRGQIALLGLARRAKLAIPVIRNGPFVLLLVTLDTLMT